MADVKIVLLGAGSYSWGPGVLSNLLGSRYLDGSRVVMHDINPEPLDLLYSLALAYREKMGSTVRFEKTTSQEAALDDADYVVVTISTGGLQTMRADLEIPEKYGIHQTVGDSVGPGGLSRALRSIPVFIELAETMEDRCPGAWMLNLSNPLSAITSAVTSRTGIRAVGLCHGVIHVAKDYATLCEAKLSDCAYVNTGIDHCSWFTSFRVKGRDLLDILQEMGLDEWLAKPPAEAAEDPTFASIYPLRCGLLLGRQIGALPAIGDRHMVEFLPGYLNGMESVEKWGLRRTSIEDRQRSYDSARARIERMLSGEEELAVTEAVDVIGERQGDDIALWIRALEGDAVIEDNVNVPNIGQIPQLPLGAVVETRGVIDGAGIHPLASPLPPAIEAIVAPHVMREELTVEAALEGSFEKALAALVTDPLLPTPDIARPMLEEMLAANRRWLPLFGGGEGGEAPG